MIETIQIASRTIEWSYALLFLIAPPIVILLFLFLFDRNAREELRELFRKKKDEQGVEPHMYQWHSSGAPHLVKLTHTYLKKKSEALYISTYMPEATLADLLCGAVLWTENCKGEKAANEPVCLSMKACQWILCRFYGCKKATRKEFEESRDRVELDLYYEKEQRRPHLERCVMAASAVISDPQFQELVSTFNTFDNPLEHQNMMLQSEVYWK